jgi:hypothetical protein
MRERLVKKIGENRGEYVGRACAHGMTPVMAEPKDVGRRPQSSVKRSLSCFASPPVVTTDGAAEAISLTVG